MSFVQTLELEIGPDCVCIRRELGLLGFPRAWPSAYYENQALRSLLGKKGVCRAGRVAVVGTASSEVAQYTEQIDKASLLPWQGCVNADRMQLATQLKVVEGWAVFERLELPCGESFVAMKYAWNVLPDGRWVDFSPWPGSWDQILLAESSSQVPAQKALQSSDWQLAQRLQKLHQVDVDPVQDNVLDLPHSSKAGGRQNEMDVLKEELARALEEADEACLKLRRTEAKVAHLRQSQDMAPAVCKKPLTWGEQYVSVGALVEIHGAKECGWLHCFAPSVCNFTKSPLQSSLWPIFFWPSRRHLRQASKMLWFWVLFVREIYASDLDGVETARLYGNVNKYAYYFIDLMVGTPPQLTSVIVDTGSHLLAFPCGGCEQCGHHLEPAVDISKSSTAHWQHCNEVTRNEHCQCSQDNRCKYSETYSEGSAISGHWFKDQVRIGDSFQNNTPVEVKMGCHDSENKLFYTQQANGIMGLAPVMPAAWAPNEAAEPPEILSYLFRHKKHIDHRIFSLCVGEWGGLLTVGGSSNAYHTGGITWMKVTTLGYYVVHPISFHVDSLMVAGSPHEYGKTIVDSGTTLTYIPKPMFSRLLLNIDTFCGTHHYCAAEKDQTNKNCWRMNDANGSPDETFPTLHLSFQGTGAGDQTVPWKPSSYMSERGYGIWCLSIAASSNHDTILGISWMLHRDTIFDMGSRRLGMASAHCPNHQKVPTTLWERLTASLGLSDRHRPWSILSLSLVLVTAAAVAIRPSRQLRQLFLPKPDDKAARQTDTEALLA
eukprot:s107_g16.t1